MKLTHFNCNGFHTEDILYATSNSLCYLKSFVKFLIITFIRHIGVSASPNNTCPSLGVEKCTNCVHLKATPVHLIYKSVHSVHLFGKSSTPLVVMNIILSLFCVLNPR